MRHTDGPLLVLAGAGSGKTRVITAKIAHLIEQRRRPGADRRDHVHQQGRARDARARAGAAAARRPASDAAGGAATIATFHALGLSIVRSEAKALGLKPGFSIFDPADLEAIVAELVATADRGRARAAQWKISQWKNALVAPAQALAHAGDDDERVAARATRTTPTRWPRTRRSTSTT